MFDLLRREWKDLYNMSTELQEAIITWLQTRPEEYIRVEDRIRERGEEG